MATGSGFESGAKRHSPYPSFDHYNACPLSIYEFGLPPFGIFTSLLSQHMIELFMVQHLTVACGLVYFVLFTALYFIYFLNILFKIRVHSTKLYIDSQDLHRSLKTLNQFKKK